MAQWLVLEDCSGAAASIGILPTGTILDSAVVNIAALQAAGAPLIPFVPAMVPILAAYFAAGPGTPPLEPNYNLVALLLAAGLFPAPVPPGSAQEFTFRPGAVDNPNLGIYGTWVSLMTAVAPSAAAHIEYVVLIDFSVLGASFAIPAGAYAFGGNAILRGIPTQTAFQLQTKAGVSLSGIAQLDNFLTLECTGVQVAAPITAPVGTSTLELTRGAQITSINGAAGALIDVPAGALLNVVLLGGSNILNGGAAAIKAIGTGAISVVVGDTSSVVAGSIAGAGASTLTLLKGSPAAGLPSSLFGFAGSISRAGQLYSLPHASFGCQSIPLIAGTYFLPYGGNDAIAVATAQDQPFREALLTSGASRPRLLVGASVWAVQNAGVAAPVLIEILLNGVLVPGTATGVDLNALATTLSAIFVTNPPVLAQNDRISVRVTVGGGGIAASCVDIFCVVETA